MLQSDLKMSGSEFSCQQCDQKFSSEEKLWWHNGCQHTYACYKCSATFYTENSNYSRTQWMHHMTEEHRMQELSLLSTDKYRVIQWTFLHPTDKLLFYQRMNTALDGRPDDITTSEGETESLNNTRSNNNKHEDDAPRDVSEFSNNRYDGDVNEL